MRRWAGPAVVTALLVVGGAADLHFRAGGAAAAAALVGRAMVEPGLREGLRLGFRYEDFERGDPDAPLVVVEPLESLFEWRPGEVDFMRFRPGSRAETQGYAYRFNRLGFRGEDPPRAKPADEVWAAVIGNSSVFGMRIDEEKTFPVRLEAELNARRACGKRWRVFNYAVPSTTFERFLARARTTVVRERIDVAVFAWNLGATAQEMRAFRLAGGGPPRAAMTPYARAVHRRHHAAGATADQAWSQRLPVMLRAQAEAVGEFARGAGPAAVVLEVPASHQRTERIAQWIEVQRRTLEAGGVPFIDLYPPLAAQIAKRRVDARDALHLDAVAHASFARTTAAGWGPVCARL